MLNLNIPRSWLRGSPLFREVFEIDFCDTPQLAAGSFIFELRRQPLLYGGYELNGEALKFGPIGATKRACPDLEEAVETEFLKVLDATRRWRIVDGTLELLNGDLVLARLHPHYES